MLLGKGLKIDLSLCIHCNFMSNEKIEGYHGQ
jgi:hypothetical protein